MVQTFCITRNPDMHKQLFFAIGLLFALTICSTAFAQETNFRPQPYRAPSRAYDYLRAPTGLLPNYYSFAQPRQQLQNTINSQVRQIQQQGANIKRLNTGLRATQRAGGMLPTGSASRFRNYSHYYTGLR
jgi:hypothetical protein